jgi:hypothetical protein
MFQIGGWAMKIAVAYERVSTAGQGKSGLGLDAQREAIARFAALEGLTIAETFTEIETARATRWRAVQSSPPH